VRGGRMVFRDLDFSLAPGGALILRGVNGAGKSTLLRVIAGLCPPADGSGGSGGGGGGLSWNGEDVDADPAAHRARLCYVGHLDAVKPVLTVAENLAFWGNVDAAEVGPALARFGIDRLADLPAGLLSAGQKRRLNLARLALSDAPLWLLDEPTVSLDGDGTAALVSLIADHRARGGSVLAATHIELGITGIAVLSMAVLAA